MTDDGEVWTPNKSALIRLGYIHALFERDVVARTELGCQGELQRGNQSVMHPWPQRGMFQIRVHTRERTGHRHPPLVLLWSIIPTFAAVFSCAPREPNLHHGNENIGGQRSL